MLINKDLKVELIASKDVTLQHLMHAHLDAEKKRLVATDGHRMVIVPVTVEKGDDSGSIPVDAIKQARKLAGKSRDEAQVKANGAIVLESGATMPRPKVDFPPYEQVVPSYRPGTGGTVTIAFNARYLHELAQALGTEHVELTFKVVRAGARIVDPIIVGRNGSRYEAKDPLGVLMPMCR